MSPAGRQPSGTQLVDVKISIPEIKGIGSFWIREYPSHKTFDNLYDDCGKHPDVGRSGSLIGRDKASRHFWFGDRMMLRTESVHTLSSKIGELPGGRPELSLTLRRDLYHVGPANYVKRDMEYTYLDTEDAIDKVLKEVLSGDEKQCCFDLCDWHGHRLAGDKSLASYKLWPAREETGEFPSHANLLLKPRITRLMIWIAWLTAVAAGLLLGYVLWVYVLKR